MVIASASPPRPSNTGDAFAELQCENNNEAIYYTEQKSTEIKQTQCAAGQQSNENTRQQPSNKN